MKVVPETTQGALEDAPLLPDGHQPRRRPLAPVADRPRPGRPVPPRRARQRREAATELQPGQTHGTVGEPTPLRRQRSGRRRGGGAGRVG